MSGRVEHWRAGGFGGVAGVDVAFSPVVDEGYLEEIPLAGQAVFLPLDDQPNPDGALRFLNLGERSGDATCSGSACPGFGAAGRVDRAVQFDGVNDYIPMSKNLPGGEVSFGGWVRPERALKKEAVFGFNSAGGGNRNLLYYGTGYTAGKGKFCYWDASSGWQCSPAYEANAWYHVMVVIDAAGNGTLYINGQAAKTFSTPVRPDPNGTFSLGQEFDGAAPSDFFQGRVDEARVFGRALSASEVHTLYLGQKPLLVLPFEENAPAVNGATLVDDSPWGNDATLITADAQDKRVTGQVGAQALALDGADDYLVVTGDLDSSALSFGGWVRPERPLKKEAVLAFNAANGNNRNMLYYGTGATAGEGKFCYWDDSAGWKCSATYPADAWHYVMVVIDSAGNATLYVDGAAAVSFNTAVRPDPNGTFSIGQEFDGATPGDFFQGQVDDVRVYPRALTAGEIVALMAAGWQPATLANAGAGVGGTTWTASPPAGLEGNFRLQTRAVDALGNLRVGGLPPFNVMVYQKRS
ncbi:MAG: LamG domain-containing protein [Anaerolineae bacterium]